VKDEDVSAFYETNKDKFQTDESVAVRHILIGCAQDSDEVAHEKAQAEAQEIHEQLIGGGDFAELAREKSSCPSSAKGGELGSVPRGQTVPEFEQAAFAQALDEIGPVVKTAFGYHIIQVTDKQDAGLLSEDVAAVHIRQQLEQQAKGQLFTQFLQSLRSDATIEYGDPTGGIIIP